MQQGAFPIAEAFASPVFRSGRALASHSTLCHTQKFLPTIYTHIGICGVTKTSEAQNTTNNYYLILFALHIVRFVTQHCRASSKWKCDGVRHAS